MKTLTIFFVLISSIVFAQTKILKENFGLYRTHEIISFSTDTIKPDSIVYKANFNIYREGIDGSYSIEINKSLMNKVNSTIDFIATKPEYSNFEIITK